MNQEPTRECADCSSAIRTFGICAKHFWTKQRSIKPPVEELSPELSWGDELVEKSFLSNILDGIDIADKQMGNKGGGTKAIRFALQSRIGIDLAKEREQAFNSGRASMVESCVEIVKAKLANNSCGGAYILPENTELQGYNRACIDILQALKNKETKE